MLLLLSFAFLAGLVTILAPCIWPLLPIILSSSVAGKEVGHKRPLGLILGIMISFAIFTLTLSSLVKLLHFDPNILRYVAVVIIALLGIAMIVPGFNNLLELGISRLSSRFGAMGRNNNGGFWAGFITGLSLGIVWSPCAGPILASIAVLSSTGKVTGSVVLVTVFYVLGVGIPLFIFAILGRHIFTKSRALNKYTGRIQQIFGVIMILTALLILTNYDKVIEAKLLDAFPGLTGSLTAIDANPQVKQQLNALKGQADQQAEQVAAGQPLNTNYPAPEFVGITKWLNPDKPLTLVSLRGKVVLIDFWAFSCLNCIRTLPYVTSWYDKYKDDGFVVIGVHAPEFEFEKDYTNLANAINQYHIHYPVAADNDFTTWQAYNNDSWPAEYLIDKNGNVRRTSVGEGDYDKTEQAIQLLLKEAGAKVTTKIDTTAPVMPQFDVISRETYVGASRMEFLYPNGSTPAGKNNFTLNEQIPLNTFSLGGEWTINADDAISGKDATIAYHFKAQHVYLTLMTGGKKIQVKVFLDGKPVTTLNTSSDDQHEIISLPKVEEHTLRVEFMTPGTDLFTFQFA